MTSSVDPPAEDPTPESGATNRLKSSLETNLHRFSEGLNEPIDASAPIGQVLENLPQLFADTVDGAGLFFWLPIDGGLLRGMNYPESGLHDDLRQQLHETALECFRNGRLTIRDWVRNDLPDSVVQSSESRIIAVTIGSDEELVGILIGLEIIQHEVAGTGRIPVPTAMELVHHHDRLRSTRRALIQRESELELAAAIVDLAGKLESCDSSSTAARVLVEELRSFLGVDFVALGMVTDNRDPTRIMATSRAEHINELPDVLIGAVLDEVRIRGRLACHPASDDTNRHASRTLEQFAEQAGTTAVQSSVLRAADGQLEAVWMIGGTPESMDPLKVAGFFEAGAPQWLGCFRLLRKSERGFAAGLGHRIQKLSHGRRLLGSLLCLVALFTCFVPLSAHVAARCEMQPVMRRFITAPFDGRLDETLVEPGDLVRTGQLLALLDGRELQLKLDALQADRTRLQKERDGHMAARRFAEAQSSRYELQRIEAQRELVLSRQDGLEVRSPFDGVVISGDLQDIQGGPVKVGDSLFEIAPLKRMRVEVAIPEADIPRVRAGMEVALRLDSEPGRKWTAKVERIHPRAELHNDRLVFFATLTLDNEDGTLRPGTRGRAWIRVSPEPLAAQWLSHPWNRLRLWLGW